MKFIRDFFPFVLSFFDTLVLPPLADNWKRQEGDRGVLLRRIPYVQYRRSDPRHLLSSHPLLPLAEGSATQRGEVVL